MEIKQIQSEVDAWITQFQEGYWEPSNQMVKLIEEVGELAREINHSYGQKPKKESEEPGDIALEIGDILFVLVCLANSLNIDLAEAFNQVMEKYRTRDKNRWTPINK